MDKQDVRDRLGNIDQIRDILFGSQQREFDHRFAQIESELALLSRDFQDRIEEVKASFDDRFRQIHESVDKRFKQNATTTQEELAELRQQNDRLNRRFDTNLSDLDRTFEERVADLNGRLTETRNKLAEDVRTLRSQIFEELDSRFATLQSGKVARADMAEILFELAMRLKGEEVIPSIQAAVEVHQPHVLPPATEGSNELSSADPQWPGQ